MSSTDPQTLILAPFKAEARLLAAILPDCRQSDAASWSFKGGRLATANAAGGAPLLALLDSELTQASYRRIILFGAAGALAPGDSISGTLVGSAAGAFDTYQFTCAAGDPDQTITLQTFGGNPSIADALNFGVYGPGGLVGQGLPTDTPGERALTFDCDPAGAHTVQVFNYVDGFTLAYTLVRTVAQ